LRQSEPYPSIPTQPKMPSRKIQDRVGMRGKALKAPRHQSDLALDSACHRFQLSLRLLKRVDNFRSGSNTHRDLSCQVVNILTLATTLIDFMVEKVPCLRFSDLPA